jgi:acetylornithine deacetylase
MEGDTIRGRGACDTKGVFLAMVEAAAKLGHPDDLGLLLVAGEEVDHCGADAFSAAPPWRPERIILGEPTRSKVVTGQKGVLKLRVTTTGQEGHSAFPGRGHSAIHTLLDALHRLRALTLPSREDLGHSTLNVGLIQGGVAANVFAPTASAVLMIRAAAPTTEIESAVVAAMGDEVSREILSRCEPQIFEVPDGFSTTVIPFNSDAAWLSGVAPVWLAGPGDIRLAHSIEERISLEELNRGVGLYTALYRAAVSG